MASAVEEGKIFAAFFEDNADRVQRFGIETGNTATLDTAFGITGLARAISATHHLAEWRMVVIETPLLGGTVDRKFGFDLTAGPAGQETRVRYFAEVPPEKKSFYPKQSASMYLTANGGQGTGFENKHYVIKGCETVNNTLVLLIEPPENGREIIPTAISIALRSGQSEVVYPNQKNNPEQAAVFQPGLI